MIGSLNCRSIRNKLDGVLEHITNNNINICFLQETFMKSHDTAICNEVKDYGLKMISVPRKNGGHGGLGVIYTSDIKLKLSSKQSRYKTFEYFECVMKSNEGLIRFCNIIGYHILRSIVSLFHSLFVNLKTI